MDKIFRLGCSSVDSEYWRRGFMRVQNKHVQVLGMYADEVDENIRLRAELAQHRAVWQPILVGIKTGGIMLGLFLVGALVSTTSPTNEDLCCCPMKSSATVSAGSGGGSGSAPSEPRNDGGGEPSNDPPACDREPRPPFPEMWAMVPPSHLRTSIYQILPRAAILDTETSDIPFIRIS
jgi:hypothetical protein